MCDIRLQQLHGVSVTRNLAGRSCLSGHRARGRRAAHNTSRSVFEGVLWSNAPMVMSRLQKQIAFVVEVDKLKTVLRQSYLTDQTRKENSAEHSWHLCVLAMLLSEYANAKIDLLRVMRMLVIHDVVEIDAGDTFAYDGAGEKSKPEREGKAANRLFGVLPEDQATEIRALWEEFEARDTAEAKFATAVDRLIPLLHNFHTAGRSWREHGITAEQVYAKNRQIEDGSEILWEYARDLIAEATNKHYLS